MANTWNQAGTTWGQNLWGEQADLTLTLTAPSALTSSVGAISPTEMSIGLTGQSATSSVGSVVVERAFVLTAPSAATSSVGSLTVTDMSIGLTGQSATSSVGSVVVERAFVLTAPNAATTGVGDLTINNSEIQIPQGSQADVSVGSISPADVMGLTGVSSTASVGSISPAIPLTPSCLPSLNLYKLDGKSVTERLLDLPVLGPRFLLVYL